MSEKRINVLFVSSWYPSRVHTTLGNFVQKHAEAAALYSDVCALYVCFDENHTSRKPQMVFEEIRNIKTLYIYCKKTSNPFLRFYRYFNAYQQGLKWIVEHVFKPDLINANIVFPVGLLFYFLKSFKSYPFVINEHWAGYLSVYPARVGFLKKFILRKIIKRAAAVMPDSTDLGNAMQQLGMKGHYETITNVVDTKLFSPPQEKKLTDKKHLLHISTLDPHQKNFTGLLSALAMLKEHRNDFVLDVVSDGDFDCYRETIARLGLEPVVHFHGKLDTAGVAAITVKADILLLFSRYENFPCVIPEAISCGVPVLSTNVGGIAEHLDATLGCLVESGDEKAFTVALSEMLDHPEKYDVTYMHQYAETHFSYQAVGKKYLSIYQQTLKK